MKSIKFTHFAVCLALVYLIVILTVIAYNSGNQRYQFSYINPRWIIDTKSGKVYEINEGKLNLKASFESTP